MSLRRSFCLAQLSLVLGTLVLALASSTFAASDDSPSRIPQGAKSGDLIFRKGTEPVSALVRTIDGGEFTHVGLLIAASDLGSEYRAAVDNSARASRAAEASGSGLETAGTRCSVDDTRACGEVWLVLHATPSEVAGRPDSVVLDGLDFFTSPHLSAGYAVYHVATADEAQRRAAIAAALAQLGQPFSLTDPNGVYCTELPYAAWLGTGIDLEVRFRRLAIFLFAPRDFLLPSALMASPKLELLRED